MQNTKMGTFIKLAKCVLCAVWKWYEGIKQLDNILLSLVFALKNKLFIFNYQII